MGGINVYEPCNYASMIPYYRALVRLCDYDDWSLDKVSLRELKRGWATLAYGSGHMHASHTIVGNIFDTHV